MKFLNYIDPIVVIAQNAVEIEVRNIEVVVHKGNLSSKPN